MASVTIVRGSDVQPGYIPTRYPGSERSTDDRIRMARTTVSEEAAPGFFIASGQRILLRDGPESETEILSLASLTIQKHTGNEPESR